MMMLLAIWACEPERECLDDTWCEDKQTCLGGTCFDVECNRSEHCPGQQWCEDWHCKPGCESTEDCLAGDVCEAHQCVPAACESTELDCGLGERCDTELGECLSGEVPECSSCEQGCGEGQDCLTLHGETCEGEGLCPEGWSCYQETLEEPRCPQGEGCPPGATCEDSWCVFNECRMEVCLSRCDLASPDCPGGFLCTEYGPGAGICYADCPYLMEQGYLP